MKHLPKDRLSEINIQTFNIGMFPKLQGHIYLAEYIHWLPIVRIEYEAFEAASLHCMEYDCFIQAFHTAVYPSFMVHIV